MEAAVEASEMAPEAEAAVVTVMAVVLAAARARGLTETKPWLDQAIEWKPGRK